MVVLADSAREVEIMDFDVSSGDQARFNGYGPAPFPDKRDDELDAFIAQLRHNGSASVEAACSNSSESARRVMCAFAQRAASRAVRDNSEAHLVDAAVALVLGGLGESDYGALMNMALVDDAAHRINVDVADVFERAASVVGHPGTAALMLWLSRRPEDRTPESMGYVGVMSDAGFRYRWS
jgi:hypothetical protein